MWVGIAVDETFVCFSWQDFSCNCKELDDDGGSGDDDLYVFVDIIEHRIVPSGFMFPHHAIEYLTEFEDGETLWLREMCFLGEDGEYAQKYLDYLTRNGIRYA